MTQYMKAALLWFRRRGGDGVFAKDGVLLCAGERAPIMRATWNRLRSEDLVEEYEERRRLRITDAGRRYNLYGVVESGDMQL